MGWCADFYVFLFGVVYLAWCDFEVDPTESVHQMLCKISDKVRRRPWQWLDKCPKKKAWAVHGAWMACSVQGRPRKTRQVKSKVKSTLILFFDIKGIVHKEFVLADQTVNSAYYCDVLRRLRENVKRLRPELWRQKNWLLHHDNAPSHTSFFTK
jgi:hypothetical protein